MQQATLEAQPQQTRLNGTMTAERPNWDAYYLAIARATAARVTCPAGQVGCIAVSPEGVPLIFGYNGAMAGLKHCDEVGCSWVSRTGSDGEAKDYPRHLHAEANAISRAARVGARLDGATLYVTQEPCPECLKLCVQAGITAIVVAEVKDPGWFACAEAIGYKVGVTVRKGMQ